MVLGIEGARICGNFVAAAFFGAVIYGLSYAISWIWSWPKMLARGWTRVRALFTKDGRVEAGEVNAGNFWRWTLSGAVYGALVMVIGWLFLNNDAPIEKLVFLDYFNPRPSDSTTAPRRLLALVYLGVPLMLLAQLAAEMIFVGLTSGSPTPTRTESGSAAPPGCSCWQAWHGSP